MIQRRAHKIDLQTGPYTKKQSTQQMKKKYKEYTEFNLSQVASHAENAVNTAINQL